MQNEQIERFLDYLTRDPVLQRDLMRRARSPEQFYANATRFAGLFGYSFSADQLKAWVQEFRGGDLLKLTERRNIPTPSEPSSDLAPAGAHNPLRAA